MSDVAMKLSGVFFRKGLFNNDWFSVYEDLLVDMAVYDIIDGVEILEKLGSVGG